MGHALLVVVLARKLELSTVRVARMKMTMLVDSHHAQIVARTTMVIVSGNVDIVALSTAKTATQMMEDVRLVVAMM